MENNSTTTTTNGAVVALDFTALAQSTRQYQQTVLRLAESSNTNVAWVASQHVLDQIWKEEDGSYDGAIHSQRPLTATAAATTATTTTTTTEATIPIQYACQECGYRLHPGWNATQIRVERPTKKSKPSSSTSPSPSSSLSSKTRRTIRRREQRKRAKQARAKAMKAKTMVNSGIGSTVGVGSRRPNPSVSNNDTASKHENRQQPAEEKYRLVLLEDDPNVSLLDRNRLVVKCGRCHAKYYLRGPRKPQQPRGKPHYHLKSKSNSSSISRLQSPNDIKRQSKSAANQSVASTTINDTSKSAASLQDNFEPLPPAPVAERISKTKRPYTPSSLSSSLSSSKPKTLLEQRQEEQFGRKKKKKKKDHNASSNNNDGKSKLLNFLSSLNDP